MKKSVDFIGVGTGPFNLSIAALSHQIEELDCLFFDEHPHFSWHPGMLVPDCHTGAYSMVLNISLRSFFSRFWSSLLTPGSFASFAEVSEMHSIMRRSWLR